MLTKKYLNILHYLNGWQLMCVLYYKARLKEKTKKTFGVTLPKNLSIFPCYTDQELWDILFKRSDFLAWKKFKRRSSELNISEVKHLKDDYYKKYISNRITDFNKRSDAGQFEGQMPLYPSPRIARMLPQVDSEGKIFYISKHIENFQEADLASSFWERSFKRSAQNIAATKTCVAYTLSEKQRNILLQAGKNFIDDINNNRNFDIKSRFPDHNSLKLMEFTEEVKDKAA
jgi:hypothetical protein